MLRILMQKNEEMLCAMEKVEMGEILLCVVTFIELMADLPGDLAACGRVYTGMKFYVTC